MEARQVPTITYAQYRLLPDEPRCELIDGVLYAQAAPTYRHTRLAFEIGRRLGNVLAGGPCQVTHEAAVRFEEGDDADCVVQPDVLVVCDRDRIRAEGIVGAPTLIVEVLSPSTYAQDMGRKLRMYQKYGVAEYWIVFQDAEIINQYVLIDGHYRVEPIIDGEISSATLPGFVMAIRDLYAAIDA